MSEMLFPEYFDDLTKSPVLITGIHRSGTSIVGEIVGTLKDMEYAYEPWFIKTLDIAISEEIISQGVASALLFQFIANEVISKLNCSNCDINPNNFGFIYNLKSHSIINRRMFVANSYELINEAKGRVRYAFKYPGIYHVPLLLRSGAQIIVTQRNIKDIIKSLFARQWFKDATIRIYPAFKSGAPMSIPYVPNWNELEHIERCVIFAIESHKKLSKLLSLIDNYLIVQYDELITNPVNEIINIIDFLHSGITPNTQRLLSTINRRELKFDFDIDDELEKCDPKLREELERFVH